MKLSMDTIQFENRWEIENIALALNKFLKAYPNDKSADTVKELVGHLDVMNMTW